MSLRLAPLSIADRMADRRSSRVVRRGSRAWLRTGTVLLLVLAPIAIGCRSGPAAATTDETKTKSPNLLEKLFPEDPDHLFFDDRSREIEDSLDRGSKALERSTTLH